VRYLDSNPDTDEELKSPQDELHAFLAAHSYHFPQLEGGDAAQLHGILAEDGIMTSNAAKALASEVLVQYQRDAEVLPLERMAVEIGRSGLDPGHLAEVFRVDLATVFRRLAGLPDDLTGPVGLTICDASGAMVFRKPFAGFPISRLAGGCPLWPLYQVLTQPHMPLSARLKQAGRDTRSVQAMAIARPVGPIAFNRPPMLRGYMLLLPDTAGANAGGEVELVGSNCRICPKPDCAVRREASVVDEGF